MHKITASHMLSLSSITCLVPPHPQRHRTPTPKPMSEELFPSQEPEMRGTLHNKNQTLNPKVAQYPRAKPTKEKETIHPNRSNRNCCTLKTKGFFNQPLPSSGGPAQRFPTLMHREKKVRSMVHPYPQEQFTTQMFCKNTKRKQHLPSPRQTTGADKLQASICWRFPPNY